ncbi:PREDICTED: uncharacterized protein LOC108365585, partial [Rhagoletis zephyria]|uniref:uncharacterized protein LOC108365585 n=2 Tax=Rhagoletis zephyria TaxID=28612 RepID=UPI0008114887
KNPYPQRNIKGKSTESALHEIVGFIEKPLHFKQNTLAAFLDIEGAFNNIEVDTLIQSLIGVDVDGGMVGWSLASFSLQQQVVELSGYVIILVKNVEGKIKLYGSPPDRDNLEVGDEILEVNGLTLENISYAEIIRHIYECIKSCTICLRVRKKNDTRLAWDIGNSVQEAFVIAVEEHARERLKRLAALNRVTPVDITEVSKTLQQTKSGSQSTQKQDLSFLNEASPIYVTSFTSTQITCSSSTVTTATAATAGLITSSTFAPTVAATATGITTTAAVVHASAVQSSVGVADRSSHQTTAAIVGASTAAAVAAATATKLANHSSSSIYQQQQLPQHPQQQTAVTAAPKSAIAVTNYT